jgi:hypothetical protein
MQRCRAAGCVCNALQRVVVARLKEPRERVTLVRAHVDHHLRATDA